MTSHSSKKWAAELLLEWPTVCFLPKNSYSVCFFWFVALDRFLFLCGLNGFFHSWMVTTTSMMYDFFRFIFHYYLHHSFPFYIQSRTSWMPVGWFSSEESSSSSFYSRFILISTTLYKIQRNAKLIQLLAVLVINQIRNLFGNIANTV